VHNFIKLSTEVHRVIAFTENWRRCWKQYCRRFRVH